MKLLYPKVFPFYSKSGVSDNNLKLKSFELFSNIENFKIGFDLLEGGYCWKKKIRGEM